ncbi:MAG: ATP-binding cassette domain-containing protein [Rhodospirillaceae bacterium]|nr:ATP-binding cassette domain-containing protein [Rhodospirillaceae bacterium]
MSPAATLVLQDVSVRVGGRRLFQPLDLTVTAGRITTIMGPSGSGKSSLLALICGTLAGPLRPEGRVLLDGVPIGHLPPERRGVGILFQDDLLFPHLSVGENLLFGMPRRPGTATGGRAARRQNARNALANADLAGFFDRDPATLSGGQRARVAVLRTLLAEPRALLLDEPFSKLDMELRGRFRRFVFDHAESRRLPTLLVTHDMADADSAGGPMVTLACAETKAEP